MTVQAAIKWHGRRHNIGSIGPCGWQESVSPHTGMPMWGDGQLIDAEPSTSYSCAFHMQGKGGHSPLLPGSQIPAANGRQEDSLPGKRGVSLYQSPACTGKNGRRRGSGGEAGDKTRSMEKKAGPRKNHQLSFASQVSPPRGALSLSLPNAPLRTNTCVCVRCMGPWVMCGGSGWVV